MATMELLETYVTLASLFDNMYTKVHQSRGFSIKMKCNTNNAKTRANLTWATINWIENKDLDDVKWYTHTEKVWVGNFFCVRWNITREKVLLCDQETKDLFTKQVTNLFVCVRRNNDVDVCTNIPSHLYKYP